MHDDDDDDDEHDQAASNGKYCKCAQAWTLNSSNWCEQICWFEFEYANMPSDKIQIAQYRAAQMWKNNTPNVLLSAIIASHYGVNESKRFLCAWVLVSFPSATAHLLVHLSLFGRHRHFDSWMNKRIKKERIEKNSCLLFRAARLNAVCLLVEKNSRLLSIHT